jgi:cathepsin L
MDSLSIRGITVPALSQQQLMNCGNGGQCNGYWFSDCADDLIRLKGLVADSVYPYTARTGSCKNVSGEKFGQIQGKSIISNAHKSMMNAINAGYPLSVTVGADSPFMNYRGGIYNACTNQGTNHQTVVQGYDCEDQVDANGNCILDSDGYVAAGKGFWYMRNSWGTGWGEQGWMKIKMSKPGNKKSLCNNLNEEVGLLETGIPVPQPKPPEPPPEPPKPPAPSEQLPFWVWLLIGAGGTVILIFVIKGIKK